MLRQLARKLCCLNRIETCIRRVHKGEYTGAESDWRGELVGEREWTGCSSCFGNNHPLARDQSAHLRTSLLQVCTRV